MIVKVRRKYKCFILALVTRVVNSYGPQTRALGSGQEQSPSKPVVKEDVGPYGVEERLNNIETHLKMKGMADQNRPKEKFAVSNSVPHHHLISIQ